MHLSRVILYVRNDLDQLIDAGGITAVKLAEMAHAAEVPQRDAEGLPGTSTTSSIKL